jgi:hypothetical protein
MDGENISLSNFRKFDGENDLNDDNGKSILPFSAYLPSTSRVILTRVTMARVVKFKFCD